MEIKLPHFKNVNPVAVVGVLFVTLPTLCVLLFRLDMGDEKFYQVMFPVYILAIVAVVLVLVLLMFMGVAWCLKLVQKSDNANVAEAAKWKALAAQANYDRAALRDPGKLIEVQAQPIEEDGSTWRNYAKSEGQGVTWIE